MYTYAGSKKKDRTPYTQAASCLVAKPDSIFDVSTWIGAENGDGQLQRVVVRKVPGGTQLLSTVITGVLRGRATSSSLVPQGDAVINYALGATSSYDLVQSGTILHYVYHVLRQERLKVGSTGIDARVVDTNVRISGTTQQTNEAAPVPISGLGAATAWFEDKIPFPVKSESTLVDAQGAVTESTRYEMTLLAAP
jgi:hypothetical protein